MNIERIRKLLKERGMSLYRLSKITGINSGKITEIMNGHIKYPTIQTVVKIAKALNVSIEKIVDMSI